MREQMDREAMQENIADWEEKEEEFHRSQNKLRSEIRINEGREKAIDILAKNLRLFKQDEIEGNVPVRPPFYDIFFVCPIKDTSVDHLPPPASSFKIDLDVELTEPHRIFDGLGSADLEELQKDLKISLGLGEDLEYWTALEALCNKEHAKVTGVGSGTTFAPGVAEELNSLFAGKNRDELIGMEKDIQKKLVNRPSSTVLVLRVAQSLCPLLWYFLERRERRGYRCTILGIPIKADGAFQGHCFFEGVPQTAAEEASKAVKGAALARAKKSSQVVRSCGEAERR